MFRELFQGATALPSPQGISNCPQSRAMYAIDLLLEWRKNSKGIKTVKKKPEIYRNSIKL